MQRFILVLAFLAAGGTWLLAEEKDDDLIVVKELPRYTELLEWVNAVKRPGFELLKASRQKGCFIAVFKTKDGDIAFCDYKLDGEYSGAVTEVADLEGNDLHDIETDRGDLLVRTFKTADSKVSVCDGSIYPLLRPVPKKVRVRFAVSDPDETGINSSALDEKPVFDEIVEME